MPLSRRFWSSSGVVFKGPAGFRLQSIDTGFEGTITALGGFKTDDATQPTIIATVVRYKNILKTAAEPYLDHDMIYRQKQGFGAPMDDWFREGDFGARCLAAFERSALRSEGFIDAGPDHHTPWGGREGWMDRGDIGRRHAPWHGSGWGGRCRETSRPLDCAESARYGSVPHLIQFALAAQQPRPSLRWESCGACRICMMGEEYGLPCQPSGLSR